MPDVRGLVIVVFVVVTAPTLLLAISNFQVYEACANAQSQLAVQRRPDPEQVQRVTRQCLAYGRVMGEVVGGFR